MSDLLSTNNLMLKALEGFGGYLKEILGTVPHDLVGYFGGDSLKIRRTENFARILEKASERLDARKVKPEPASLSIGLPILIAAAEESREELQDIWARLLAAAADPKRAPSFRIAFIETVKKLDVIDAIVLEELRKGPRGGIESNIADQSLGISQDELDVSVANLQELRLILMGGYVSLTSFGREFLRALSD